MFCFCFALGATQKYQFSNLQSAQRAASLLGLSFDDLSRNVFNQKLPFSKTNHYTGLDGLQHFITSLYDELFQWIVYLINRYSLHILLKNLLKGVKQSYKKFCLNFTKIICLNLAKMICLNLAKMICLNLAKIICIMQFFLDQFRLQRLV